MLNLYNKRLTADDNGEMILIDPVEIMYCESVDNKTFIYTDNNVYKISQSLTSIADTFHSFGYFRCSKCMVVNLHKISTLKAGDYGRIVVTLENSERILVSRHYAKALKNELIGE